MGDMTDKNVKSLHFVICVNRTYIKIIFLSTKYSPLQRIANFTKNFGLKYRRKFIQQTSTKWILTIEQYMNVCKRVWYMYFWQQRLLISKQTRRKISSRKLSTTYIYIIYRNIQFQFNSITEQHAFYPIRFDKERGSWYVCLRTAHHSIEWSPLISLDNACGVVINWITIKSDRVDVCHHILNTVTCCVVCVCVKGHNKEQMY